MSQFVKYGMVDTVVELIRKKYLMAVFVTHQK